MSAESPVIEPEFFAPRTAIDDLLFEFLTEKAQNAPVPHQSVLTLMLRDFISGGKRIRPLLCVTGWIAAGGRGDAARALRLAASIELAHTCALIHDDIMDASTAAAVAPRSTGRWPTGTTRPGPPSSTGSAARSCWGTSRSSGPTSCCTPRPCPTPTGPPYCAASTARGAN